MQQMKDMAKVMGCHWLELVTDDAFVVFRDDEVEHFQQWRQLTEAQRAEVDNFIKFKLQGNPGDT